MTHSEAFWAANPNTTTASEAIDCCCNRRPRIHNQMAATTARVVVVASGGGRGTRIQSEGTCASATSGAEVVARSSLGGHHTETERLLRCGGSRVPRSSIGPLRRSTAMMMVVVADARAGKILRMPR